MPAIPKTKFQVLYRACKKKYDNIYLFLLVPDIEQPEVTVVRCNMDGSYDVMLKYEVCVCVCVCVCV